MVRSAAIAGAACVHLAAMRRVSNHEAILRDASLRDAPQDEVVKAKAAPPVFFAAPGAPSSSPSLPTREAERRETRGACDRAPGRLAKPPDTPGEARRLRGDGGAPLGAPLR